MGKGMSSKASRRFISKKGKLRGTHFHSILAIVCARKPVPASMLKTEVNRQLHEKALGLRTWAEARGWSFLEAEAKVKVNQSTSYLDVVYALPNKKGAVYIEAKSGYRSFFRQKAYMTDKHKKEIFMEKDKHKFQVAGGCLSWNKERDLAKLAPTKKNAHVLARPEMVAGYVYYINGNGAEEVREQEWARYYDKVKRRWGAQKQKKKK